MAWKLATSPFCSGVFCCPGNAGTAAEPKTHNISLDWQDARFLLQFIREKKIGVTLIGPEVPLADGLGDRLRAAGHFCFGPGAAAARLEGSKAFCKDFVTRLGIPTAPYRVFDARPAADSYLAECDFDFPCVIKYDGLAAGKGVTVAADRREADHALDDIYKKNKFNSAGTPRVVIESFLTGQELSFMVAADGTECQPLATSQDHKARDDGDKGPNTGGMGAYSPFMPAENIRQDLLKEFIEPTLRALAADEIPYLGFLYAGLMIDKDGRAKLLEYNCRLGDPETQALLFGMETDLAEWLLRLRDGEKMRDLPIRRIKDKFVVTVVMAAAGYPDSPQIGAVIRGIDNISDPDVKVFHSGTAVNTEGKLVTAGGRVLSVTALGRDLNAARQKAYATIKKQISWPGAFYRTDIGARGVTG